MLAGSFADGVPADAILITRRPPIPPTNIMKVRGRRKNKELATQKTFTSN